ncbi:MAG: 16S rRNA (cytosine(1402)-N(4))-methyltransferase [Candidatus Harrisonbacteria bacterium RIFCSPHIGHO2_02_FULL_40_20]|nr:MAG: 16S rRNA (cytosine(1402)-N(4))-methyltransferase [Candidatus Harrisonbacteria bacterium RIFCSPHIGHO2_02_FULL_40_20]
MGFMHKPVLLNEVINFLDPQPGEFIIDGTFGSGGHAQEILKKLGPDGKLLGVDWDEQSFSVHAISDSRFSYEVANYSDLSEILKNLLAGRQVKTFKADGLLLDLGFSSEQLGSGRGFSFQKDEPLLMAYNSVTKPAKDVLKDLSEEELAGVIKNFGEERFFGRIARAIKDQEKIKPIETTGELVQAISRAVPMGYERGRIHPATRTFQALRIYVNNELGNLEKVLKHLEEILNPGGRVVIISFHSLEDRIVKNYFRDFKKVGKLKILTKKPITASLEEIAINPRSRSAKLRAAEIL